MAGSDRIPGSPSGVGLSLSRKIGEFFAAFYELFCQLWDFLKSVPDIPKYWAEASKQINRHILETLPLGLLIAVILGIGDSMQAKTQASVLIARQFVVNTIFKFGILDLYPFVLGLVLAGKIGSSVAAEIGSMQITGQIDALKTMSIRPVSYLGWPRVAASMIMFPLITIISDVVAVLSLSLVSLYVYAWVSYADLVAGLRTNYSPRFLITQMILKPAFFGFFIGFIGYFFGSRSRRGAKGVGQASVQAAVVSALAILFLNYIIGELSY